MGKVWIYASSTFCFFIRRNNNSLCFCNILGALVLSEISLILSLQTQMKDSGVFLVYSLSSINLEVVLLKCTWTFGTWHCTEVNSFPPSLPPSSPPSLSPFLPFFLFFFLPSFLPKLIGIQEVLLTWCSGMTLLCLGNHVVSGIGPSPPTCKACTPACWSISLVLEIRFLKNNSITLETWGLAYSLKFNWISHNLIIFLLSYPMREVYINSWIKVILCKSKILVVPVSFLFNMAFCGNVLNVL